MEIKKVKKDVCNYLITFFNSREKNRYNYALLYCLLDDLYKFIDHKMVDTGNILLDLDFKNEYVKEVDKNISFETVDDETGEFIINGK
jgi:hypothetical protein